MPDPLGQQSSATPGAAPSAATPIPAEVLLKIARAQLADPSLCAVIEGNVEPGSELQVGERRCLKGRFKVDVPRRPGQASARLAVRTPSGRPTEKSVACRPEADPS